MGHPKNVLCTSFILFMLLLPTSLFGNERAPSLLGPLVTEGTFVLTVEADRLSLKAREASLKAIVEEIGRTMRIEVLGEVPEGKTITIAFEGFSLEKSLQRFGANYGYQLGATNGGTRITKIFLLPSGTRNPTEHVPSTHMQPPKAPVRPQAERHVVAARVIEPESDEDTPGQPQPLQFEFDPSALMGGQ